MVDTQLTPDLIQEGVTLVEGLDEAGVSPSAALWFYFPDIAAWRLVLGEVQVGPKGPREAYRVVQKTLKRLRNRISHLALEDIVMAKPDARMIQLLRQVGAAGPGISGMRVTSDVINGTLIEDAYIYRLKKPA